jgi:hypothetical protein
MKIIISPYSAKLRNGNRNPKNYHAFDEVIHQLKSEDYEIIQIGVAGETRLPAVDQFVTNWPFAKLKDLVNDCATWIAVDNFFPHFCHCERLKRGITIFGQSDPAIFGYPENINLLRDRKHLRPLQYHWWEDTPYREDVFVTPDKVIAAVHQLAPKLGKELPALMMSPLMQPIT